MDYKEALKLVQAAKPKDGYLRFRFGYDAVFILPHKAGMELISALAQAEQLKDPYNAPPQLSGITSESLEIAPLSIKEYERIKIAQLLGVTLSEAKQAEQAANSPTP